MRTISVLYAGLVTALTEAAIEAALKAPGGDALAYDQGFTAATDKLSDDALTRFYADPAGALEAFGGAEPDVTNLEPLKSLVA
jgi:hypothetical protein